MAVKVADTLRPNNSGEEAVKGGFPTALACDVWLADGRSVEEALEGTSGASIQVAEIPEPSEAQFGKIYQYIGETTDDYINGYFYECIIEGAAYKWVEKTVQKSNADISEEEDNVLEQKTDGLYVRKTTAILFVDALPEYGSIDDYIYRIQSSQYKELVIDGSIMNGDDVNAAMQHMTEKGFVVSDPDEPDHEGYYEAVFRFRDIEYHDELTDQYKTISKFYIRKSASIVGDKFIAKLADEELTISSQEDIPLRYKEELMYLGDEASQSLARMVLYSDLETLDADAVIYDDTLPIPADRKNKVYCTTFTNDSLVFDTTNEHYLYDIVDYARKNNFTFEYSTEYYVIVQTSSKEVYQSSDRSKRVGRIDVYIGSNNVTLTVYDTTNTVIKSEESPTITLDLITETLTPYLCQIDSATSYKLLSYDEYKSSILTRVVRVPENAASGFYQEDLYTNVVIKWTSIESVIESLESSGFTVTPKESDPSQYWIDFPNNYKLLRISHPSLEEHLTTKDLCERMDLKMSGSYPTIGVYCNGVLKISFSGSNFRYATEQDSDDKNGTKLIAVNNNGDKTRLALYSDVLRNITQKNILPAPSKENLGKVYQYVGNTNVDYRKGSFYECISDEEETPTYSWRELGSGGSITIKDVNELPTSNIENIIYRLTSTFEVNFNQGSSQMALATKGGFTYTENTVDGVLTREWTTDTEAYVKKSNTQYKRVNRIIYKYSTDLHCYHKIMYNDEVIDEAVEWGGFVIFYFKIAPAYYAGDTINQKTERLAKYDEIKSFIGTQAEWDALSASEKEAYDGKLVNIIGDSDSDSNLSLYADTPIGTIAKYGGTTAPDGWLLCNGQALSKTEYVDLFNAIGTNYGGSDTTFNLPTLTQLKQDYTAKTQLDTWTSNLEDGSESHTITIDTDGSYYFEVMLSNASNGKQANNISITTDGKLVSSWGYIGAGASLTNKTVFLKKGTCTITHICQTAGIGGTAVVTVYNTRNEPVGTYIIKAKQTPVPVDFMSAVREVMNEKYKILPYELNRSSNVPAFNRKWLVTGNSIVWTATHTGRLTIRCLKHGDGFSLYLTNQNSVMLDSYDNFYGDETHALEVSEASITLQAWVRKGDVIELSTNLPANTDWADKYFVQTGLLLYNNNYD